MVVVDSVPVVSDQVDSVQVVQEDQVDYVLVICHLHLPLVVILLEIMGLRVELVLVEEEHPTLLLRIAHHLFTVSKCY